MLLELSIGAAALVLLYVILYWHAKRPFTQIPGATQILPLVPIKVPYLAEKAFIFGPYTHSSKHVKNLDSSQGVYRITTFTTSTIFLRDPELVKDVALRRASEFPKPSKMYDYLALYGNNILNTNDDVWKKHRIVSDPAFAEHHNAYLVEQSNNATQLLINRIEKQHPSRIIIDPFNEVQDVTLDVIGKVAFGYDLGIFEKRLLDTSRHSMSFLDALKLTMSWGFIVQSLPTSIQSMFKETKTAVKEVERYMRELVDTRMENLESEKHDLLSLLVSSNQERGGLTDRELMSDVFIFLLAGHETSATTLQWMTYELAINPSVQKRAYEEIVMVIGTDGDITYEDYEKLSFVQACVNETLRLHPPVVGVPKVARKDTTIGSYKIPAGTDIILDIMGIHLDEKVWPQATKFKPERFIEQEKRHPCSLIPFSIGLRKCIGFRFSEIETLVIIAKLIQKYEFVIPSDDPKMNTESVLRGQIPMYQMVTLKPDYLKIELKRR